MKSNKMMMMSTCQESFYAEKDCSSAPGIKNEPWSAKTAIKYFGVILMEEVMLITT